MTSTGSTVQGCLSPGLQAAVAFIVDLTPHSERAGAGGGGIAAGGMRFAYHNLGNDPHGFGNNSYSQGRVRSLTHVNAGATAARANMRLMTVEDDTAPITVENEAVDYNGNLVENGAEQLAVEETGGEIVEIREDDEYMLRGSNTHHVYSSNFRGPLPHSSGFLHQHGMYFAPPAPLPMAANHTVPQFHRAPQLVDMHSVNVVPHTHEDGPGYAHGAVGTDGVN